MLARIAAPPSRIAVNKSQVVTTAVLSRTYCIDGSFSVAAVQLRWSRPPPQPIRASGGNPSLPRHPVTAPGHQRDTKENLGVTPTESCGDRGISHHNGCGFLGMCPRLSNSVFLPLEALLGQGQSGQWGATAEEFWAPTHPHRRAGDH